MTSKHFTSILPVAGLILGLGLRMARGDDKEHSAVVAEMQKAQEHVTVTQRYPLVGIPLMDAAPTIDGKVDVREWSHAARVTRFLDYNKGQAVRDKTDLYIGYTATHLFIAFQFERPKNALHPTEQDIFELLFDTPHSHAKYYNAAFSVEKVMWDGIGPNVDKKAWEPKWDYKGRTTDFGWEGEIAIAFKEFGMEAAPSPGTIWGADFVRNEHTPVTRLAVWAFRGKNWHNVGNLGHVQFTGKPVAVRVEGMGWIPETQQAGVKLLVSNFSDKPVTLDAAVELRKTDKQLAMEYYPKIDSAMAEELPAAIGSPLKNEVKAALEQYAVLKQLNDKVTIAANESKLIQLVEADAPGNYLASFLLTEDGKPLAGSLLPVEISVPLAIRLDSYLYSAQTLAYEVDLRRVADKVTDASSLRITVKGPDGNVAAQDKKPIPKGATEVAGELHFAPTPDSTYTVVASVVNGDAVAATNQEHLRVAPKPVWLGNELGKKKFVPDPFKPIEASGRQCKVLTSTYEWPEGALFPQFKVFDREVLAAPVTLTIKDKDGKELPVTISSFTTKEQGGEKITYEVKGSIADKGSIDGTISVEFDGLAWYRINVVPKEKLELSSAALEFVLKKEYARYCTVGAAGKGTPYSGAVPAEGMKAPFSFAYWLGGIDGGVQWFAENPKNWFNASEKDVTQISTDDKVGRLKINFIDKPVALEKPIDWSFGFIATPSRVKPKGWGEFAFFQTGGIVSPPAELKAAVDALKEKDPNSYNKGKRAAEYYTGPAWQRDKKFITALVYHGYWQEIFGYPGTYDPKRQAALKKSTSWLHGEGIKVIVYAGWGVNMEAPEWRDYGMEMVRLPLYNSGYNTFRQCPTTLWQDWFVYKMAEMIREYDIDGIFIDSVTSPMDTENFTPGMRWTDEKGKVRGSYPVLATRQWLMRLYKLWHGELKSDGIVYNHNSPPTVMAIENFQDVRTPSEFAQTHPGEFDQTFVDFFTAKNAGEQFGIFCELTNKDWMGGWAKKKTPQIYAIGIPLNVSFKAVNLYEPLREHGSYALDQQMMVWLWQANEWVNRSTAEYLPWWKNSKYITTTPADNQVLTAIWLQRGDRLLLCVSNLNKDPRKIEVKLNLGEMGLPASVTAEDAVTGEKYNVDGGKMTLDIDFERFRLVKVSAAK